MIASFQPEGKKSIKDVVSNYGVYNETESDEQTFAVSKKTLKNKPVFSFFTMLILI